jgi:parallel beta-helix repeat protein
MLLLAGCISLPAHATTLTVPDQAPTIQVALDARVDTVLVRPGAYPETLVVLRAVTVQGVSDGSNDRPSVLGLWIHADETGPPFTFRRLQVKGTVVLDGGGWSEYVFSECDLQGSLTDNLKNYAIWFSKCRVTGSLDLWADGMEVDSCEVAGSVACSKDSPVTVRGCTIQGGGVFCPTNNNSVVEGNTIRGGGVGVYSRADGATIANNLIEDCLGDGITIDQGSATISNNVIRRCGVGISVGYANGVSLSGNTIEHSRFSGLALAGVYEADVMGNTFWMCAGDGMRAGYASRSRLTARNNTSCYNGLSGFVSDPYNGEAQEWTGNIGYGNNQHGFQWLRSGAATFGCNDWYGNLVGQVQGRPFSGTEFSVDPQFCDGPGGDLHLNAASPVLSWPGCGPIGALGAGCGSVAGVTDGAGAPVGFALASVGPVPSTGRIALEIVLPRAAAIEVAVHDIQGRTVARLAGGEWTAGRHAIEWNGEGTRGRLPPGLYLIRYRFPGGQDSRRTVISR